jgi:hypothetical protein
MLFDAYIHRPIAALYLKIIALYLKIITLWGFYFMLGLD